MLKKSVNGCNGDSFSGHCVLEGDRVPLLKGHGQALEQKHCFPGIFSDGCDASANLLNEFDGLLFPRQLDRRCACWVASSTCPSSAVRLGRLLLLLLLLFPRFAAFIWPSEGRDRYLNCPLCQTFCKFSGSTPYVLTRHICILANTKQFIQVPCCFIADS